MLHQQPIETAKRVSLSGTWYAFVGSNDPFGSGEQM